MRFPERPYPATSAQHKPAAFPIDDWAYVTPDPIDDLVVAARARLMTGMSVTGCLHRKRDEAALYRATAKLGPAVDMPPPKKRAPLRSPSEVERMVDEWKARNVYRNHPKPIRKRDRWFYEGLFVGQWSSLFAKDKR